MVKSMDIKLTRAWYVKRMCHLLMAVVLTAGLLIAAGALNTQEVHAALSGNGTSENPYKISSYADLKEYSGMVNVGGIHAGYAELANDIQCGDYADWEPIGNEASPFQYHFDGKGYVIRGLSNEKRRGAAGSEYQGLFGRIINGEVKNVGLEGGKIIGEDRIGGIAGSNFGTIENCYNTATISGRQSIGGIAGENYGTITNCWNAGEVNGKTTVGGVAGSHNSKTISSCFNTGKVTAVYGETAQENGKCAGGITGSTFTSTTITDCYNTGAVSAVDVFGGVAGENFGTIVRCYYDKAYSAVTSYAGNDGGDISNVKGLQTSEMTGMYAISGTGMNFSNHDCWLVRANGTDETSGEYYEYYPHLKGFNRDSSGAQLPAEDISPKNWPAKPHVHMQGGKKTYFLPWERTDQLPDTAGSYYLTGDVGLDRAWNPPGAVSLCLNDHSIANTSNEDRVIIIKSMTIIIKMLEKGRKVLSKEALLPAVRRLVVEAECVFLIPAQASR